MLKERITTMPKTKKSAKKKQHPNITKAIATTKKLQKDHQKMALDLKRTAAALQKTPFTPFR